MFRQKRICNETFAVIVVVAAFVAAVAVVIKQFLAGLIFSARNNNKTKGAKNVPSDADKISWTKIEHKLYFTNSFSLFTIVTMHIFLSEIAVLLFI